MKILFIEDNKIAQEYIKEVFEGFADIMIVGDYSAAMVCIEDCKPDFVVTDIFFPFLEGSGIKDVSELAERVRDVINTALKSNEEASRKCGWYRDFLKTSKPFYLRQLSAVNDWENSADENDQSLGMLIAQECKLRMIPWGIITDLFHHNEKVEGIFKAINWSGSRGHFDIGTKEWKGSNSIKETREFWQAAAKAVARWVKI
jgi:CheY-like chemotaxis protein